MRQKFSVSVVILQTCLYGKEVPPSSEWHWHTRTEGGCVSVQRRCLSPIERKRDRESVFHCKGAFLYLPLFRPWLSKQTQPCLCFNCEHQAFDKRKLWTAVQSDTGYFSPLIYHDISRDCVILTLTLFLQNNKWNEILSKWPFRR